MEFVRAHGGVDRAAIFRLRGLLPLPAVLVMIAWSDPTLHSFAAGGVIVLVGIALRFWAAGYIKSRGEYEVQADRLVTAGPYAFVRNPLYSGNFLIGLGFCVVANWWPAFLCALPFTRTFTARSSPMRKSSSPGRSAKPTPATGAQVPRLRPPASAIR